MTSRKLLDLATAVLAVAAALIYVLPGRRDVSGETPAAPGKETAAGPYVAQRPPAFVANSVIDDLHSRAREIEDLKQGKAREEHILELAKEWGRCDVKNALKWANTLPGVKERCVAIAEILSGTLDPVTASQAIEFEGINISQVSRIVKTDFISPFMISLARELGHTGALAWVAANMTGFEQSAQISNIVGDAASLDSAMAAKLLKSLPAGKSRDLSTIAFVRSVALTDPEAGAEMLASYPDLAVRQMGASQLVSEWIQRDAAGLRAYLASCPNGPFKNEMIGAAATQMAYTNPESALSIANGADQEQKEQLLSLIYKNWARSEPLEALRNLQAVGEPASIEKFAPAIFEATVLNGRFADAGTIVQSLSEGEGRIRLTVKLIETWYQVRPMDSGKWLDELGAGPSYDAGAGALVRSLAAKDPESALMWADTIGEPVSRDNARELIQKAQR